MNYVTGDPRFTKLEMLIGKCYLLLNLHPKLCFYTVNPLSTLGADCNTVIREKKCGHYLSDFDLYLFEMP